MFQNAFTRQSSFEQRWQDVESVLSLRCVSERVYASVEFRAALAGRGECVEFTVCFRTRLRVSRVSSSAGRTWRVC